MEGTLRYQSEEIRELIKSQMIKIASGIAQAHGSTAEIEWGQNIPPVINHDWVTSVAFKAAEKVTGDPKKLVIVRGTTGAEDFGAYSKHGKACFLTVGVGGSYPGHNPKLVVDENAMPWLRTDGSGCPDLLNTEEPMNKTRLISDKAVRAAISIPELIPVMDQVFTGVSNGTIRVLPRNSVFHENGNIMAIMASSHPDENICGCKVAMFPGPATAAAGTAQSVTLLFSVDSGELQAIVSADYITVARTAAATAAATDRLARKDARGAVSARIRTQSTAHAEAICAVRDVKRNSAVEPYLERLERACSRLRKQCPACKITGFTQTEEAVDGADIVCTVSKAREPILKGEWLAPGCHVNAIGACGPIFREIDESVRNGQRSL